MSFTFEVKNKKVKILSESGAVYLDQEFDPTKPGFESFDSNSAAETWAAAWIAEHESELAARDTKAAEAAAYWAAEEAKAAATIEEVVDAEVID